LIRRSSGAVPVCVDHGVAAAQPFDAAERRAQPFRGDVGIQPGIWLASRVAFEPPATEHCQRGACSSRWRPSIYSDLANKMGIFSEAGERFYCKSGTPNSWAPGNYVLLGQDSIDFDLRLTKVWMRTPVAETPNNWVEVEKHGEKKIVAEVGKETFEVEISVSLKNGKIISAAIANPVEGLSPECEDAELSRCGPPKRFQILRRIDVK
jgi:hypothetical protein